jgi:hypothetical protein
MYALLIVVQSENGGSAARHVGSDDLNWHAARPVKVLEGDVRVMRKPRYPCLDHLTRRSLTSWRSFHPLPSLPNTFQIT